MRGRSRAEVSHAWMFIAAGCPERCGQAGVRTLSIGPTCDKLYHRALVETYMVIKSWSSAIMLQSFRLVHKAVFGRGLPFAVGSNITNHLDFLQSIATCDGARLSEVSQDLQHTSPYSFRCGTCGPSREQHYYFVPPVALALSMFNMR